MAEPKTNRTQQALLTFSIWLYKTGNSCLYIKKLGDVDLSVLKELVAGQLRKWPTSGSANVLKAVNALLLG
jgi:hypothetical protein